MGATVDIGRVRPTTSGVRLEDVRVAFEDAPTLSVALSEVTIQGGPFAGVTSVSVRGGSAKISGTRDEIGASLAKIAARRPAGTESTKAPTPIRVDEIEGAWTSPDGVVSASGIRVVRVGGELTVGAREAKAVRGARSGSVRGLTVSFERGPGGTRVKQLDADEMTAELGDDAAPQTGPAKADAGPTMTERARDLRERATQASLSLLTTFTADATAKVARGTFTLHRGGETLHVGPGAVSLELAATETVLSFQSPRGDAGSLPLGLTVRVPKDATAPFAVDVFGGPVPLSSLGVREGDLGLSDVAKTTVEATAKIRLLPDGKEVHATSRGKVRQLSITNAKLAKDPVKGLDLGFVYDGSFHLDGSYVRVDKGELDVGSVHAEGTAEVRRGEKGSHILLRGGVPLASCQGALDALPAGLAPHVAGMKMSGTFAVKGAIDFSSDAPDKAKIELSLVDECRVTHAPDEISTERFRKPFRRSVYAPDGKRVEVETGPGTPEWIGFSSISPFMEAAVLTCEDGRFHTHRGFDVEAIRNSIRENLKAGKFLRGASTISMQTAKNLYLDRDKTLGRKLEEAILTSYLEQTLSKPQILELYFNIIEYGPMVYGIGPASQHYFRTSASQLSLGQALYLGSILPNPKAQHFGAGGRVTNQWMGYLHRLMRTMPKRGVISETDAQEGLSEWVVFGSPKPARAKADGSGVDDSPPPLDAESPSHD